jgi:glycosyltransferase involved in cell wall biosynthesis
MKIAYMGTKGLPSKGGMERALEAIVKRLAGKHDITVYCDSKYTPAGTMIPGVRLIRVSSVPGKYSHPTLLFLLHALHALFLGNYDLIHMHGVDASFTLPILRLRYRVISTSQGSATRNRREKWGNFAYFLQKQSESLFCQLSNSVTSVSIADAEFYHYRYHKKVTFVPNGVDENISFNLDATYTELNKYGVQPGKYLLFAAGRIDPSKGCHLVIEAFNSIKPDIPLLVVGDLGQVPSYAVALRQMAVNQPIHFIPLITDKEFLFGIVKLCKLFIFPSTCEGMSLMLLEAASIGVPIICSDIPENRTALQENTIYFRSGDSRDLAEKIQWAFERYPDIEEIAHRARETLIQTLSWKKIAVQYERLYQQCISGNAPKHNSAIM